MSCGRLLGSVLALFCWCSAAQDTDAWDRTLRAHVVIGGELEGIKTHVVNYTAIAKDADFMQYIKSLETADVSHLTKNQTYALFMNAYNALAIKMIVDHSCKKDVLGRCLGPISSILDIGSHVGPASTVWLQTAGRIGGRSYSLQQIEDYLRAPSPFGEDARLHACIVCASISCPNLRNEAFRAETIDAQMDSQVKDMLSNDRKGLALDRDSMKLTLSRIYDWYAADFKKAAGSVIDFVLPFVASSDDRKFVSQHREQIALAYFDYNWHANGKVTCSCRVPKELAQSCIPQGGHCENNQENCCEEYECRGRILTCEEPPHSIFHEASATACIQEGESCSGGQSNCCSTLTCEGRTLKCEPPNRIFHNDSVKSCIPQGGHCENNQENCCEGYECRGRILTCEEPPHSIFHEASATACIQEGESCSGDQSNCCSTLTCEGRTLKCEPPNSIFHDDSVKSCIQQGDSCENNQENCCEGYVCGGRILKCEPPQSIFHEASATACIQEGKSCSGDQSNCCTNLTCEGRVLKCEPTNPGSIFHDESVNRISVVV